LQSVNDPQLASQRRAASKRNAQNGSSRPPCAADHPAATTVLREIVPMQAERIRRAILIALGVLILCS